jgi:hypothetical protein
MKTAYILYHIARADFLERVRRYSFLLMLGLVLWIGYLSASGLIRMRVPPDYLGVINSAWVGATMTVTVSLILGWVGFYIVKGSIQRDYQTGVGQILATTPISRPMYMLGKWLSNFAVLAIAILILLLEGILMNLFLGTEGFDLAGLAAPLVVIALPWVAMVAAFAVLFEAIPWLRGGFGNIVYFLAFIVFFIWSSEVSANTAGGQGVNPYMDFSGMQIIGDGVSRAARAAYPDSAAGFTFSFAALEDPKLFYWEGIQWSPGIYLSRVLVVFGAAGIALLSSALFDRFNPGRTLPVRKKKPELSAAPASAAGPLPQEKIQLSPLAGSRGRFRFGALVLAELKLFLKGQPWWWYAVAGGLILFQLSSASDSSHIFLILAWLWPVLILSKLGCREIFYDTQQFVFSAPRPAAFQLPAQWLSAFIVIALLGSGALLRFLLAGEIFNLLGWFTGVLFIPSLALVSGVLSGSSKIFEAGYVLWMYLLFQQIQPLDFMGLTPASPLHVYAPLALILFGVALFSRQQQLKKR